MSAFVHETVLLDETVRAVLGLTDVPAKSGVKDKKRCDQRKRVPIDNQNNQDDLGDMGDQETHGTCHGIYVDATFGRGGHSRLLLSKLDAHSTLIVFDKDPQAITEATKLAASDRRVKVVHDSFGALQVNLKALGIDAIDGLIADLGVSSPQLDDGARGFSFMKDGVVDMRMDTSRGETVGQWLARVDEEILADVLYRYGEERHSRRIARAIKQMESYDSTLQLAEVIKQAHPAWQKGKHPATQSFQAMRIFINDELGDVSELLDQSIGLLKTGGRLAVISFHSLEDRLVKTFLQDHSRGKHASDDQLPFGVVRPKYFGKPLRIEPSADEIKNNPRSRSAHLRVAVRTDVVRED